jgi:hypothetical protein
MVEHEDKNAPESASIPPVQTEPASAETDATMLCAACRSRIPAGASICSVCKSYQNRWRRWATTSLTYAGGIAIILSGATFAYSQGQEILRRWMWHDEVAVAYFNSGDQSMFINTGDGDVYLKSVEFAWYGHDDAYRINALAKRGEGTPVPAFLTMQPGLKFTVAENKSGAASPKLLEQVGFSPCLFMMFLSRDLPERTMVEHWYAQGHQKPIAISVVAYLEVLSLHTGRVAKQKLDVDMLLGVVNTPDCAKIDWNALDVHLS